MDLRQLRYFIALAESGNFHRAAGQLCISQPPLTVAIRKLEEELGAQLFERHARGTSLTDAGRNALPAARAALEQANLVKETVQQGLRGIRGNLVVGFVGSAISTALPRIIPAYRAQFPDVDLRLEEMTSLSIAAALQSGQVHIGLVRLPLMKAENLQISVIEEDEMLVALPQGHWLAKRDPLPLSALADEDMVMHSDISILRPLILLACQEAGFIPRISQEATQVQTIISLVQSGLGVALVPANMAKLTPDGVVLLRLKQPLKIKLGAAMRVDGELIARNFMQLAEGLNAES